MLEKDYNAALSRYQQAMRMSGVSGMDVTADAQDVINTVEELKQDVIRLKKRLAGESALKKAELLEEKMETFLKDRR